MSESIFRIPSETKVIAFDWDMTLVDSHGKLVQNKAIAHEFGNPLSEDDVRRLWNESTGFPDLMAAVTPSWRRRGPKAQYIPDDLLRANALR